MLGVFLLLTICGDIHPNPGPIPDISICHINVRSLLAANRLDLIEQMLTIERCFVIICASETKLDNTINNSKVNINDYSLYRKDRNRQGGGVAIGLYVSQNILSVRNTDLDIMDIDGIEILWVELTLGSCCFLVGACYRPPGMSSIEVDNFIDLLKINIETIPSDR